MDIGRWLRFVAGGAANTAVTYAVYLALIRFMPYLWAYFVAYVIGIVIAFVVNSRFVFRVPLSLKRFFAYPLVYIVQYLVSTVLLAACVEVLGLSVSIAPLVVIATMIPVSYLLNRFVLVRAPDSGLPGSSP
ncbi:MAG: GtrA family protein [Rhodospirillaceae bacterium]